MLAAFGGVDVLDHFLGAVGLDDDGDDTGGRGYSEFWIEKRFVKGVLSDVFSIEHKIAAH